MDDRSTISWMIMGGPRYDEHSQAELDHLRALSEQRQDRQQAASARFLGRFARFFDNWTARSTDSCTVDGCTAAGSAA